MGRITPRTTKTSRRIAETTQVIDVYKRQNVGGIEGKDYMIDMIRKDKITAMIQKAKQQADCIIFVAHWGTEDETMPYEYEKQWAASVSYTHLDWYKRQLLGTLKNS